MAYTFKPRAIQLRCFYTGRKAEGKEREAIEARINKLMVEMAQESSATERAMLYGRIEILKGNRRPVRA